MPSQRSSYFPMACIAPSLCMDNQMEYETLERWDSRTLKSLAKQLQFYKPPNLEEIENGYDGMRPRGTMMESSVGSKRDYVSPTNSREKRAAVLICIFQGVQGELRVILTKRSMNLSSHPGEVALPGGKMDEGDEDDSATALREAMEEIGLDPSLVQVVANLEPFISAHLLTVVPVVGLLHRVEDFTPVLSPDEVDAVFNVPLEMFLKEENHRHEEREWGGWKYVCNLFDYESEQGDFVIGGLTASILIRAASIVYQRPPSFSSDHLPDFQQLHRTL